MNFDNPAFDVLSFVILCFSVGVVISLIGGWAELARVYRFRGRFEGTRWRFQSCYTRLLMGYHDVLTVGANQEGLYLAIFLPFSFARPALFIPWQDVSANPRKFRFSDNVELRFRQGPSVYLSLSKALSDKIAAEADSSWPGDHGGAISLF